MILNELVLQNVGTFAGRQVIDLTPPSKAKPIVLVGGLNGAGKTTILEAIHLALYGALASQGGRRTGSYERYLRGLIHRGVPDTKGAAIELTFTAYQEGTEHTYWVRRSWRSTGASVREILLVSVDGRHDRSLTSTWNEHVETFLPRGIAGLFFFDGEQIEALADLERSRQVLGSALTALLGLDLVDRLATDLLVIKRRHRGEQVPEELRQAVDEKMEALTRARQAEEAAAQHERECLAELERRKTLFHDTSEQLRAAGGDLLEQREGIEAQSAHVRSRVQQCEEDIRTELGGATPLLQVGDLLEQLLAQSRRELQAQHDGFMVGAFTDRDRLVLDKLTESQVSQATITAIREFLESDRDRRRQASDVENILGISDSAALEHLLGSTLPESRRRLERAVEQRKTLKVELEQTERVLAAIPDPEALGPLTRHREEARNSLHRAEAAAALATEMAATARAERVKASAAHEAALDKAAQADLEAEDDRRLVEHADRVRTTLESLRVEATRRHLERISQLVLEALGMLLRKERLVTDVQIDPDTHTVSLTGVDGHPLPARNLSAGERQLLAVALLWGLARAAGQPLPVVIDTPLGRLDGSHRGHLLDRYFPQASHQVVLLSTDTEIDEEAFARIGPKVGRSYHLVFDRESNATTVEDGYFWE
ncbi:DNA sulfur modification protein DndD [Microbacter sp. ANSKLAB05]|nr:DNA sulfur modification protein DndD [Microbacter sp. ANSKLAB05]